MFNKSEYDRYVLIGDLDGHKEYYARRDRNREIDVHTTDINAAKVWNDYRDAMMAKSDITQRAAREMVPPHIKYTVKKLRSDNPTSGNAKMNKFEFIRANGTRIKANRFMEGPTLRPGMAWRDESPLGSDDHSWREVPSPHSPESDPNHPSYNNKIFGYDEKEFMARQYKTSRQKNPAYLVDVGTRGDLVPRINKLEFQAKRWFQKTYGNTYFAVKVYVNDALVYTSPVEYGYERQYETDAANALAEMGFDVPKGHMMGYWARENGIEFISNAVDVKTERELKAFAAPKKRGKNPTTVSLTPAKATRYLIVLTKVGKVAGYWTGTTWDDERRMGKRYVSEANVKKAAAKIAYITRYVNYKIGVLTVKESVPKK